MTAKKNPDPSPEEFAAFGVVRASDFKDYDPTFGVPSVAVPAHLVPVVEPETTTTKNKES